MYIQTLHSGYITRTRLEGGGEQSNIFPFTRTLNKINELKYFSVKDLKQTQKDLQVIKIVCSSLLRMNSKICHFSIS